MHTVTLFIPSLFPAPDAAASGMPAARFPTLERLLGRGKPTAFDCDDAGSWLCKAGGIERQSDWPVAPVALLGEGRDPGADYWLCATPVCLHVHHDQLVLLPPSPAVTTDEAQSLVEALNRHFAEDGLRFEAPHPQRWYLHPATAPRITTTSLDNAIGRDINRLLPEGDERSQWHGLFNETQMLLHAHPVNQAREDSGKQAINSVWFWGGGKLPAATVPWDEIAGDNPIALGLARLAGIPALAAATQAQQLSGNNVLVVLPASDGAAAWEQSMQSLERDWLTPLAHKLFNGQLRLLRIETVADGRNLSWTASRRDLWKFWKPAMPLTRLVPGQGL